MKLPGTLEGSTIPDPDPSEAAQVSTHPGRRSTGARFQPVLDITARKAAQRRLRRSVIFDPGVPVEERPFPVNVRLATPEELEALAPLAGVALKLLGVRR
jgi:hypothetical protein